ncbi:MAG: ADOP family duplicated permease [Candidatus Acidiferrales bacterium]
MISRLRAIVSRVRGFFSSRRLDADFQQELAAHLAMLEEENLRRGLTPDEARRQARLRLGAEAPLRETQHDLRGLPWLESVVQDVRFGLRMLRKSPSFTAVAVLTLALGIGANTAIFSLVDVVLFRPLPIAKPEQVLRLTDGVTKGASTSGFVSFPSYLLYREHSDAFSGMAAYLDRLPVNISANSLGSERIDAGMVTGNYFQTLGVKAAIGRVIVPEDNKPGSPPVVMLSHDFLQRRFSEDAKVLGTTILVDGQQFTIVGVTPSGFGGVSFENLPEIWIPMTYGFQIDPLLKSQIPLHRDSFNPFAVVARLKRGVSISQAQAQLNTIAANMGAGKPEPTDGSGFVRPWPVLVPATAEARHGRANYSSLVLAIAALVLLIACADTAGLFLARAEARQKEVAVRLALGATRFRIIRLHVIEGLLASLLGALAGILFAIWSSRLIAASAPPALPIPLERASSILDLRVLAFTASIAIAAGLLSNLLPAFKYSRSETIKAIKGESSRVNVLTRHFTLQSFLVVAQLATSVVLLAGAGLLIRTLWQFSRVTLGFDPGHTVAASTDPIRQGYDKAAAARLLDPLLDSLRAQPGVTSAALGSSLPLQPGMGTVIAVEGHRRKVGEEDWVQIVMASPDYFKTLGMPLLNGRDFTSSDTANAPGVAVIDEAMAEEYWPGADAVGKHIEHVGPNDKMFEIVGTVGNVAPEDLRKTPGPVVYIPISQAYLMFPWEPDINLLARTTGDPRAIIPSLRAAVAHVNPALPVFRVRTMRDQIGTTLVKQRFLAHLLVVFGLLAIVLCAAGVYGLVSYTTERSIREFGIRVALGAQPRDISCMVLRRSLMLAVVGSAIGLTVALGLTRLLISLLYGVTPTDPLTFTGVALLAVSATAMASYLPARRASRVDPMVALRHE